MANFKYKSYMLYQCLKRSFIDWKAVCKGQKAKYELLQTAHRLEKGLTISTPRPLWGWGKAERLYELLLVVDDSFAKDTGRSVLTAYLNSKEESKNEQDRQECLMFRNKHITENGTGQGGAILYNYDSLTNKDIQTVEKLFKTRHSIRDFLDLEIPDAVLLKAIELALRCPSACNRQPFHIYVIDNKTKDKIGNSEGYNGNKYLYITGDIRAFTIGEMNDWIVTPSIFAGYLTLALHLYGIGACVIRKDLVCDTQFNNEVKKVCGIPKEERLILELAIGYYKKENIVPYSNRHNANEITSFIK